MRRLGRLMTMLATLLWLPTTLHCQLESLPGLAFLKCASEEATRSDSHCDDNCCSAERADYRIEEVRQMFATQHVLPLISDLVPPADELRAKDAPALQPSLPPPKLPKGWQFVFRTASPPRAPSFVS